MPTSQKDTYFVAVKVFLERDNKLLILKDNFGDWDLPGGRKVFYRRLAKRSAGILTVLC